MSDPTIIPSPDAARQDAEATPPATIQEVDAVIQHTDSGSGSSQAEHWPANVSMPD